jgi:hypothetical protein
MTASALKPDELWGPGGVPWPVLIKIVVTTLLVAPFLVWGSFFLFRLIERIRDQIWNQYGRRK